MKKNKESKESNENNESVKKESAYEQRMGGRRFLIQLLYEWGFDSCSDQGILMRRMPEAGDIDLVYVKDVFTKLTEKIEKIDEAFSPFLDRSIERVGRIELAVLRLAVYEFKYNLDVPFKVVLNEAIELAKDFGAQDSHKFINAILDRVAKQLRSIEVAALSKKNE